MDGPDYKVLYFLFRWESLHRGVKKVFSVFVECLIFQAIYIKPVASKLG
jgi:hypothetical protein